MLRLVDDNIELIGNRPMRIFKKGIATYEVQPGEDINFLIKRTK
jgi:dipeptidase E